MMRCFALLIALLLPTLVRAAEFAELYSFSAMVIGLSPPPALSPQCDGGDKWIDIKTELTGNGVFPKTPSIIVGTQLWAFFSNPRAYLMIGQTQPNGDAITPLSLAHQRRHLCSFPPATALRLIPTATTSVCTTDAFPMTPFRNSVSRSFTKRRNSRLTR